MSLWSARASRAHTRQRRWEQDGYLGTDDLVFIVALPDGTFAGFVGGTAIRRSTPIAPTVGYRIGIALLPEYRNRGLGSAAHCLMADHLFWTTMANRIEAGTDLENIVEQRALEMQGSKERRSREERDTLRVSSGMVSHTHGSAQIPTHNRPLSGVRGYTPAASEPEMMMGPKAL
jgi:RimJ/RimL family protein N-acetyltransferase